MVYFWPTSYPFPVRYTTSPLVFLVVLGVYRSPATKLALGTSCLLMNPAQLKSTGVGVCRRSKGKLTVVGCVPADAFRSAWLAAPSGAWARAATARHKITNNRVFFILPPESEPETSRRRCSLMAQNKRTYRPEQ